MLKDVGMMVPHIYAARRMGLCTLLLLHALIPSLSCCIYMLHLQIFGTVIPTSSIAKVFTLVEYMSIAH